MSFQVHATQFPHPPRPGQDVSAFEIISGDPGADDRQRIIALDRSRVLITRLVQSMKMRIAVPTEAYRGVLLSLAGDAPDSWRIALVHRNRDLDICLTESADDERVIADWRSWAKFFDLPALLETTPGSFTVLDCAGPAVPPAPKPRRRGALMSGRRARFLLRRKTGDRRRLAIRHAGEREIIARG